MRQGKYTELEWHLQGSYHSNVVLSALQARLAMLHHPVILCVLLHDIATCAKPLLLWGASIQLEPMSQLLRVLARPSRRIVAVHNAVCSIHVVCSMTS